MGHDIDPASIPLPTSPPADAPDISLEDSQKPANVNQDSVKASEESENEMEDVELTQDDIPRLPPKESIQNRDTILHESKSPPVPEKEPTASFPRSSMHEVHTNGFQPPHPLNLENTGSPTHRRSFTISRGNTVSVVLISSALETIAASKEAKRSTPLKESTQKALEMVRTNHADPRQVFEPLRLACETKNEKLMIASLDCISKLISYSFFAEADIQPSQSFPSPPPSPNTSVQPLSVTNEPSLVDLVAHTITACHTETTPETVSLQIVKALLAMVLSPTTLVHHSSLLKAVRTVYNVFLLSTDPVNQMVAQGGLTQMVHHVFTRCRVSNSGTRTPSFPPSASQDDPLSSKHTSFTIATPDTASHAIFNGNGSNKDERRQSESSTPSEAPRETERAPTVDTETKGTPVLPMYVL